MPRIHMPAEARCRQLERFIRQNPGSTTPQLAQLASISQTAAYGYLQRLQREKRIDSVMDTPETPRGAVKHFYPKGEAPQKKEAA